MIEIRHLVKTYGDRKAVNDLNISMKPGKIYGFLGKNGAGKTTTMNIMTGYIGATSGDVVIDGHNILEEPELVKRQIGYLPEVPPLYPDMTVREYLDFAAELKGIGRKERAKAVRSVMEDVRVDEMQGRLIRNLSKGYRQRVGLAQALLGYPPILILDEPTSGLDPKHAGDAGTDQKAERAAYRHSQHPYSLGGQCGLRLCVYHFQRENRGQRYSGTSLGETADPAVSSHYHQGGWHAGKICAGGTSPGLRRETSRERTGDRGRARRHMETFPVRDDKRGYPGDRLSHAGKTEYDYSGDAGGKSVPGGDIYRID